MNRRTLAVALAVIGFSSAGALAAAASTAGRSSELGEVVAQMESRYPGKVVAIALDDSGDKPAHYHVDMRFAESGTARLDVDAKTLAISSREPEALEAEAVSLLHAAALVATAVPGQIVVAELDATHGAPAHYDVDVRLPQGSLARLKVDAATRQIGWREPAIMGD